MSGIDNFLNKSGQNQYYITPQPANNAVKSDVKIKDTENTTTNIITNSNIRDEFVKEKKKAQNEIMVKRIIDFFNRYI